MRLPTPEFKILLYGPGLPSAGIRARAHFEDTVLVAQGRGHWFTIQGDKLKLKTGGFDGRQWLLSWMTPSGLVTAMLQGDDAVQLFIKLAPPIVSEQLQRVHFAQSNRGRLLRFGMVLLVLSVLASVLISGLFLIYSDEVSRWAADRVSLEQKNRLGEMAFEQLRPRLKLLEQGPVSETVQYIGVRVTTGSRNRYVFHVASSPQANAFALPGGHVVVYTGLLRVTKNPNELAAILAHTVSHVELHHTLANIIRTLGWRAVLAATVGDDSDGIWQNMAAPLERLTYNLDMEQEADRESKIMLRRAGVSSEGLVPFFERMAVLENVTNETAASESRSVTHPSSPARLDALREEVAALESYSGYSLSVDWQRFQSALSRLPVR